MPPSSRHRPQRRPGRGLVALLVFALLGLQALGQAHRALHGQRDVPAIGLAQAAGLALVQVSAEPATPQAPAAQEDRGPFGHDRQTQECRLYDQLLLADLAFAGPAAAHAPPAAGASEPPLAAAPAGVARFAYRARAPPAIPA